MGSPRHNVIERWYTNDGVAALVLAITQGIPVPAQFIVWFLGGLWLTLSIWSKIKDVLPQKGLPQPFETKKAAEYVTRHEFESHMQRVEEALSNERDAVEESQRRTHSRIDKVMHECAEIKGELKQASKSLGVLVDHAMKK